MFRSRTGLPRKIEYRFWNPYIAPSDFGPPPADPLACVSCHARRYELVWHIDRAGTRRVHSHMGNFGYHVDRPLRLCRECFHAEEKRIEDKRREFVGPLLAMRATEPRLSDYPYVDRCFQYGMYGYPREEWDIRFPNGDGEDAFAHERYRDEQREQADYRADLEYARDFNR